MRPRHAHICAGNIGLGLVGDISTRLGFRLAFLHRASKTEYLSALRTSLAYTILFDDGSESRISDFDDHQFPTNDDILGDDQAAVSCIANPDCRLLTTAILDKHLRELERRIEDLLHGYSVPQQESLLRIFHQFARQIKKFPRK
jgi:hypothetical protein